MRSHVVGTFCGIAVLALPWSSLVAEPEVPAERKDALANAMAAVRTNKASAIDRSLLKGLTPAEAFDRLKPYVNDKDFRTRRVAFVAVAETVAGNESSKELRMQAVREIALAASRGAGGCWFDGVRGLRRFSASDFDDSSKQIILQVLERERLPSSSTLGLISAMHMTEALPTLSKKLTFMQSEQEGTSEKWYLGKQWQVRKVMAQFGVRESIQHCLGAIDAEDDLKAKGSVMVRLGRIRHPLAVDLLRKYLNDDRVYKDGLGFQRNICLDAVVPLAKMLAGFPPAASKHGQYELADIPKCRKWMDEQAEWKFKEF